MKHSLRLFMILGLGILAMVMLTMQTRTAQASTLLSPEKIVNADGTLNLTTGAQGTVNLSGWKVSLDSVTGPRLTRDGSAQLAPAASTWSAFPNEGLYDIFNEGSAVVFSMAVLGTDLYVGGCFSETWDAEVSFSNIARFDGTDWHALSNDGLEGCVYAMAVMGTDLYVGGDISETADGSVTGLNGIAKYDGSAWSALAHNGLRGYQDGPAYVGGLAASGSDLYVGGWFDATFDGAVTMKTVAKYSGGAWSALPNGGLLDDFDTGEVWAILADGSDVYFGGTFIKSADGSKDLGYIAKYDGTQWVALANDGLDNYVRALAKVDDALYVGGEFNASFDGTVTGLNYIAKYTSDSWVPLSGDGLDYFVEALYAAPNGDLYVGGEFTQSNDERDTGLNMVALYSTDAWFPLANEGLSASCEFCETSVLSIMGYGDNIEFGGTFDNVASGNISGLNYIAEYAASATTSDLRLRALSATQSGSFWTIDYQIKNLGPDRAAKIKFVGTVPVGYKVRGLTPSQGRTCDWSGRDIDCALGALDSGEVATLTVRVKARAIAAPNEFCSEVYSKSSEGNAGNNSDCVDLTP